MLGTRNILAASDVREGSAGKSCFIHNCLRPSATGNHVFSSTASVKGQYTCNPLPEFTIVGRGNLLVLQNLRSSSKAVGWSINSLLGPQSKSMKKDFIWLTFICLRLSGSLNVPRAKKTLYAAASSSSALCINSSIDG